MEIQISLVSIEILINWAKSWLEDSLGADKPEDID